MLPCKGSGKSRAVKGDLSTPTPSSSSCTLIPWAARVLLTHRRALGTKPEGEAPDFIQNGLFAPPNCTLLPDCISLPCRKEMYTSLSSNFWTRRKLLTIFLGDGSSLCVQYKAVSKANNFGKKNRNTPCRQSDRSLA